MLCQLAVGLATANRVQSAAGVGCTQLPAKLFIRLFKLTLFLFPVPETHRQHESDQRQPMNPVAGEIVRDWI
jgi:hypothetical protein